MKQIERIKRLEDLVIKLEKNMLYCCQGRRCEDRTLPNVLTKYNFSVMSYYNSDDNNYNFNDLLIAFSDFLPETLCSNEKTIVLCDDGIVFLYFHEQDGWTIQGIALTKCILQ